MIPAWSTCDTNSDVGGGGGAPGPHPWPQKTLAAFIFKGPNLVQIYCIQSLAMAAWKWDFLLYFLFFCLIIILSPSSPPPPPPGYLGTSLDTKFWFPVCGKRAMLQTEATTSSQVHKQLIILFHCSIKITFFCDDFITLTLSPPSLENAVDLSHISCTHGSQEFPVRHMDYFSLISCIYT